MKVLVSLSLGLILALPRADAEIVIHEVLSANAFGIADDEGQRSDWVEIVNRGAEAVDLTGYGISDDVDDPYQWVFPTFSLEPGAHLLVWCSGKDRTGPTADAIADADGPVPFAAELLPAGSRWRFLAAPPEAVGPPPDWAALDFDASAWPEGPAPFSRENDGATLLPTGTLASFFRVSFDIDHPGSVRNLAVRVEYDDGFGMYLNGELIASRRFPEDNPVSFGTRALRAVINPFVERIDLVPFEERLTAGRNVLAVALLNVRASSRDMFFDATLGTLPPVFHTNFRLSSDGETLLLSTPDGAVADRVVIPPLQSDQSWGLVPASDTFRYLLNPSPGQPNEGPSSPDPFQAVELDFGLPGGFYESALEVTIAAAPAQAVIRYTLDGSTPTRTHGTLYDGPIPIAATTLVRAIAHAPDLLPSSVGTRSFLFLEDVLRQDGSGLPEQWGGYDPDYEVDPNVVNDPRYHTTIRDDLLSTPVVSLVLDPSDLFLEGGIYAHPENRGPDWERACSLEILYPDGVDAPTSHRYLQVNCGTRIFGYGWRPHSSTLKHAFRLVFKREWGLSRLEYPFFPDWSSSRFDDIVLRAQGDRGWTDFRETIVIAQYIRDAFARYTARDMGKLTTSSGYVQLYLNGLYWGLYNPVERPDAEFLANHLGGNRSDYDALNARVGDLEVIDGTIDAWDAVIELARNGLEGSDAYRQMERLVDIDNLIQYVLINFYTANGDWPGTNGNNMRVAGSPSKGVPFKSFCWDNESTFGSVETNNVSVTRSHRTPALVYAALTDNADFRVRFADHVYRYYFGDGPLTPSRVEARWLARAAEIDRAIVGESARWGDFRREPPYTRDVEWLAEQRRLREEYFPHRTRIVVGQLRDVGMYPSIDPPDIETTDTDGVQLQIEAAEGEAYFTLDGTDPRLPGGAVSESARSASQGPFPLLRTRQVRARILHEGEWSASSTRLVRVGPEPTLRITELLYHAAEPTAGGAYDASDLEFIEFRNTGPERLELGDFSLEGGVSFDFSRSLVTHLDPQDHVVIVRSAATFAAAYDADTLGNVKLAGEYTGRLSNSGETLVLSHGSGEPEEIVHELRFSDLWYPETDGGGHTLTIVEGILTRERDDPMLWSTPRGWRPSLEPGGSPGRNEAGSVSGQRRPGDVNQDGRVNLTDVASLLQALFGQPGQPLPCEPESLGAPGNIALLDADGDGRLLLGDGIRLLNYLFRRGPPHALGPDCVRISGCVERCVP